MDSHMASAAPDREILFVSLSRFLDETYTHLADTRALYLSTHARAGASDTLSQAVHTVFERHYTELAMTVDVILKRMQALGLTGAPAPSRSSMLAPPSSGMGDMVKRILDRHDTLVANARALLPPLTRMQDGHTADLLAARLQIHERTVRELRALVCAAIGEGASALRAAS